VVVSAICISKNITTRKKVEEKLQKSYALLKSVVESPKEVVIFALDRQYRYIAFNENHYQTMKRIWGADIALGNSMLEYIKNPEDSVKAKSNFERALSGESFKLTEAYGDTELERRYYENSYNPIIDENGNIIGLTLYLTDITERRQAEEEREMLISELRKALYQVKILRGLLPICASCKKIRNDKGFWEQMEVYIRNHSEADFSHSICPECAIKLYPEFYKENI
jgi:PAS domain S-box-containing protein